MRIFAVVGFLLGFALPAWAARPFVTDDARLTTAGSCQLESWTRFYQESREVWALPACNPTGNLELTLGGGVARADGQPSGTTDYVLQLKTLFKPLSTNGWGIGVAAGTVRHPEITPGPNQLGNNYVYFPASFSLKDDRLIVHSNLGWLRDDATRQDRMTWGLGGEWTLSPRTIFIAETFGDDKSRPYWQSGFRWTVIENLLQLDATVGQQAGSDPAAKWLSFGMRWIPERIFK